MASKEFPPVATQLDIDLMFWQFAYGISKVLDKMHVFGSILGVEGANVLLKERIEEIRKIYDRVPSFTLEFRYEDGHYNVIKTIR